MSKYYSLLEKSFLRSIVMFFDVKSLLSFSLLLILFFIVPACSQSTVNTYDDFDAVFDVPSLIEITSGGEYTFTGVNTSSLIDTDNILLESEDGVLYVCSILSISADSFTVTLNNEIESGYYIVYIKRGDRKKQIGKTYINIVDSLDFNPDSDTTIYGLISSDEGPVEGVVVSDGFEVVCTNSEGIYQLKSKKKLGYVFMTIPANYEALADGILPQFYKKLKGSSDVTERVDFSLKSIEGQESYKVLMLGDMHLANRTNDTKQFMNFIEDVNLYREQNNDKKIYAITLGDMTWDLYWYSNNYELGEYLFTMNTYFKDLQVFHTIGNHDYDYKTTSDMEASQKFVDYLAPTYYSFNIGKVHYVILDDIDCSNYDGTTSRNYEKKISSEQLDWLVKDLSYVDKSVPLVIIMHAQVFYPSETSEFKIDHDVTNTTQLFNILDGYNVNFVTGHTHYNYNVTPENNVTDGRDIREHNVGAICGSWWWSGYLTEGVHLSPDGTPGGYSIWDVSGTDIEWMYKPTGYDVSYQFRSYDLNNVSFSLSDVPDMPSNVSSSIKNKFMEYVNAYPVNNDNNVLINIWNWNSDWKVTVTDDEGNNLPVEEVWAFDPLHIAAMTVKRFNSSTLSSVPNFITVRFPHFFKVNVKDADTDICIEVQDEFGNTWIENMDRPKEFSIDNYRLAK